jgi:hypothetical protein
MSLHQVFKTDSTAETEGVWIEEPSGDASKPARFKIARAGGSNRKYQRIWDLKTKPFRRLMDLGQLDDATSDRIYAEVYAEAVVLGWENVTDAEEKGLPFTKDACVALLLELPELFADLRVQANRLAPFRADIREEDRKNS